MGFLFPLTLGCFSFLPILSMVQSESTWKRGPNTVCANVHPLMTTSSGAPVDDKITSMTAGIVGPIVLQDFALIDELAHFNRERIPERVMHAKGAGAFGTFVVTNPSFTKYCKASVFEAVGKKTNVFVRISTVGQESGSCDTVRDPRGTAIKFYTDDGNWDLVGNNTPIFFIRDPILFPSFAHSQKRHPVTHLHDPDMFWDFIVLRPETTHQVLFLFSDRGTPDGVRHMNLHGSHTFKVVNKQGEAVYVKFHFLTNQGIKNLDAATAQNLCATDPDYSTRDLFNSIAKKEYPSWTMYYQVMTFKQATEFPWNPFDVTKIWPKVDFPYFEIGRLELNKNPENYFADVEQSAFSPSHMVPGIEPSPDKMLQGRLFAYPDAHRYRLGVNNQQLPVNSPYKLTITNNHVDGKMRFGNNQGGTPNYYPSSLPGAPKVCPEAAYSKWSTTGDVKRYNADNEDNYGQAKMFWSKTLNKAQQGRLVANLAGHLKNANPTIQKRAIENFKNVGADFAQLVSAALGITM